jgi:hypothetical protein
MKAAGSKAQGERPHIAALDGLRRGNFVGVDPALLPGGPSTDVGVGIHPGQPYQFDRLGRGDVFRSFRIPHHWNFT